MIEDILKSFETITYHSSCGECGSEVLVCKDCVKKALTQVQEEAKREVLKVVDNYDGLPLLKKELKELYNSEK